MGVQSHCGARIKVKTFRNSRKTSLGNGDITSRIVAQALLLDDELEVHLFGVANNRRSVQMEPGRADSAQGHFSAVCLESRGLPLTVAHTTALYGKDDCFGGDPKSCMNLVTLYIGDSGILAY